jgi:hypothetical protein
MVTNESNNDQPTPPDDGEDDVLSLLTGEENENDRELTR